MNSQRVQSFACSAAERMELGMSSPLRPEMAIGYRKIVAKLVGSNIRSDSLAFLKYELETLTSSFTR